jgi:sortase A
VMRAPDTRPELGSSARALMLLVLPVAPRKPDPAGLRADAEQQGGDPVPRLPRPSRRACSHPAACAPPLSTGLQGSPRRRARAGTLACRAAVVWLRWIGIVRPITAALMIGGAVLIGQAVWIHAKALLAQVLLERAFATTLATGKDVKPWSWADTWPVARVFVPRLGRSAIVLAGASGQALAFGPGHVARTPAAGEPGTAIYSGHRDTHFAFLGDVAVGDEVRVTRRDGRELRFRVTGTSVVRWDASGIDPHADGRGLALVTCWPLDGTFSGPLRYVVHAQLMDGAVAP